jgi:hypothetical protein
MMAHVTEMERKLRAAGFVSTQKSNGGRMWDHPCGEHIVLPAGSTAHNRTSKVVDSAVKHATKYDANKSDKPDDNRKPDPVQRDAVSPVDTGPNNGNGKAPGPHVQTDEKKDDRVTKPPIMMLRQLCWVYGCKIQDLLPDA